MGAKYPYRFPLLLAAAAGYQPLYLPCLKGGKCAIAACIVEQRLDVLPMRAKLPMPDKANNNTVVTTRMDSVDAAFQIGKTVRE